MIKNHAENRAKWGQEYGGGVKCSLWLYIGYWGKSHWNGDILTQFECREEISHEGICRKSVLGRGNGYDKKAFIGCQVSSHRAMWMEQWRGYVGDRSECKDGERAEDIGPCRLL